MFFAPHPFIAVLPVLGSYFFSTHTHTHTTSKSASPPSPLPAQFACVPHIMPPPPLPHTHTCQVRLEAMDVVLARAQAPDAAEHAALLAQAMAHVPGWDEKNFQVC